MDIIGSLHEDHINVAAVARVAREELRRLAAGETADYALLEDIMCYVTGYPDTHHHPTEDIVFERLKERAPEVSEEVDALLAEHVQLIERGRRFLEAIRTVADESFVLREDFLRLGEEYLALLERHMDVEEGRFFPRATKELTEEDWASLNQRMERRTDPLFGPDLDEDYRRLWRRIQAHRRDNADERPARTRP